MSSLSIVRSIVTGVTMSSLARCPSALRLSNRSVLQGVGISYSGHDASHISGNGLKRSASDGQDLADESLDEKDDFYTPEVQTSGFFQENQTRRTTEEPYIMGTSVENSTGDSENAAMSIHEEHSTEAVGKSTAHSSTLAHDEESKEPESNEKHGKT